MKPTKKQKSGRRPVSTIVRVNQAPIAVPLPQFLAGFAKIILASGLWSEAVNRRCPGRLVT